MANPKHTVATIRPTIVVSIVSTNEDPEKYLFSLNVFGLPDRPYQLLGEGVEPPQRAVALLFSNGLAVGDILKGCCYLCVTLDYTK